jgi:hypothetical protein
MKIKINICPFPLCAYFYAWTDDEADEYIITEGSAQVRQNKIRFLHNKHQESLQWWWSIPPGQDDDFSITLTSSVKFNDFCHRLKNSEFNTPDKYHIRNHTCVHGVIYALKEANIFLKIPTYHILNRVDSIGLIRFPYFSITPFDLYYHLKKYKIASLRQSDAILEFNTYKNKILFFNPSSDMKKSKPIVTDIVKEIEKKQYQHEEHTEKYTHLLRLAHESITSPAKNALFKDMHQHYKHRIDYNYKKWWSTCAFLLGCVDMIARYMKGQSQAGLPKNPVSLIAEITFFFLCYKIFKNPSEWEFGSGFLSTPLSKKIEELETLSCKRR